MQEREGKIVKDNNINVNVFFDENAESLNEVLKNLILKNCNPLKEKV